MVDTEGGRSVFVEEMTTIDFREVAAISTCRRAWDMERDLISVLVANDATTHEYVCDWKYEEVESAWIAAKKARKPA